VGAGAPPVDEHRRRPPIPIVPVDARARADAVARGRSEVAVWLAGVSGGARAPRVRVTDIAGLEALWTTLAPRGDGVSIMSVGEVALAVDTGRDVAARAASDGVHVLVAAEPDDASDAAARALAAVLTGVADPVAHGPLGALRRLGDPTIAVLCGVALGAGERGLGCVCDGLAATAGAAVAAAIEPDLRPRLIGGARPRDPEHAALAAHLDLAAVLDAGERGIDAVVAALRAAAGSR
jgi:nicotinate-nucleotide--dimethylbenzimidazole phosphoribosyltransferase